MRKSILFLLLCITSFVSWAQTIYPSIDPQASYTTTEGEEIQDASSGQNAPLVARFTANPSNVGDYSARYEWKIYRKGEIETPLVHRFEQDIDYTFSESGTFYVQLYATFVLGNDTIVLPEEGDETPIEVSINESKLEFPNAISPNNDGFNDELKPKPDGCQSIVAFQATVFSRWGQKIYSWNDINGKWDGKWNGHTVKDGVYFLVVKARGADGRKYNIRKAINVITGYNNDAKESESEE